MATDHIIDIIIETSDRTGGGLDKVRDKLLRFDQSIQRTSERLQRMTNRAHDITLNLIDRVTPAGSGIQRWLRSMADRAHQVTLGINDRATSRIRETEARLFQMTAKAYTVTVNLKDKATQGLKSIGNNTLMAATGFSGDMLAGAGIGYGIYDTVKTYKNFEAQMSAVGSISGASSEQMQALTEKAMEMGAKTSFSATEAGKAFEYMATAGWKTDQMMSGIEGIMNLAAASGEDLGRVSDIVTDALTAFGLTAADSSHFSDVLAAAASNANTTVGAMGYTFQYVAPIAGAMGQSIEDVATATGLMANAGIKGEQAGTSLRFVMTNLAQADGTAQKAMKELGVEVTDSTGKMRPFMEIVKEARAAFDGLSDAEKSNKAYSIAGMNAMSGWLAMMNASEEDINKLEGAIRNADGTAKKMAETRLDNLAGDLTLLGSAWETFQLRLMQGTGSNFLREFVQGVKTDVEKFTKYIEDGFDISDVGKIAMDVLSQLKNKFLEFDGIGSVLAGGVLIGALAKITSKAMKLVDVLKQAGQTGAGGGPPSMGGAGAGQQSIGVMNVKANVVNISGGGPNPPGGDGPIPPGGGPGGGGRGGGNPPPRGGSRIGRFAKGLGIAGTVLSVGTAAYDIYSTNQYNDQMTEEADWRKQEAEKNLADKKQVYSAAKAAYERGEIDEKEFSQAGAALMTSMEEASASEDYQKRVEEQNQSRANAATGSAIGSVTGAVVGGAIGTFVGGPVGTAVGSMVGSAVGSEVGEMIGGNWSEITASASETWEAIKAEASNTTEWIGNKFSEFGAAMGEKLAPVRDAAQNEWDYITNTAAEAAQVMGETWNGVTSYVDENLWSPLKDAAQNEWDYITNTAAEAAQTMGEKWNSVSSYVDENLWTPLKDGAITGINFTVGLFATIGDEISDAFAPIASYIDTNLWTPLKDAAQNEWDYITNTAAEAAQVMGETWNGVTSYVDENLWTPLKDAAQNEWDYITNTAAEKAEELSAAYSEAVTYFDEEVWTPLKESAAEKWAEISALPGEAAAFMGEAWAGVSEWFSEAVWTPLGEMASFAWDTVTTTANAAWDAVAAYYEPAAAWFDSTVWQPISSAVDGVKSAITGAFESAWSTVSGLWGAAAGWFEANVIGPVREKFNSIVQRGASITGMQTSGGAQEEAFGGFITSPRHILAGEDGGEVIIPLSSNKRSRALDLFEKTREILGSGILGGISGDEMLGDMPEALNAAPIPIPIMDENGIGETSMAEMPISSGGGSAKGGNFHVDVGGVTFDINVSSGSGEGGDIANEVMGAIRENFSKLADDLAGHLAEKTTDIWNNQPLTV